MINTAAVDVPYGDTTPNNDTATDNVAMAGDADGDGVARGLAGCLPHVAYAEGV